MMRERRDIHTLEPSEEAIREAFGIPVERLEHLKAIGRFIGRDWRMKVELGTPGEGSCFKPEENSIQLDPLHLADPQRADMAEFVAAHEGGHRAVTRMGESLGLTKERIQALYGQLGFGFGFNAVEDPAENNWWSRQYEGLEPAMRRMYDQQFEKDAAVFGTPEINRIIQELGSAPRFAHFGSELIRLWHTGTFSERIPDDVRAALERSREAASNFFNDLPADHPQEREVLDRARSRFVTFQNWIWPEMKRLVDEDLRDERLRQMVEEQGADSLPEEARKEIEKAMKEAAQRAAQSVEASWEQEAAQKEKDAATLREAANKLEQEGQTGAAQEARSQADKLEGEAHEVRADAKKRAQQFRSGGRPRPVPLDTLSEETQEALEQAFAKLTKEERARLEKLARKTMEKIEDALNDALASKLDSDKPESHQERHEREEAEQQEREEEQERARREREERREISRAVEQTKTAYDQAYADVAPLINEFADDLDRLFLPNRHPRWIGGHPTGGRLNLQKAMQFEAHPDVYSQLWERKTIPHKRDFAFTLLIDLSGSMHGEKIRETFRAAVLTAEALSRVGLSMEVLGFQDELIEFKSFDEPFSDDARSRISGMPAEVFDTNLGGHNQSAWNDDGYCVEQAARRLALRSAKDRFLIVFSDGEPIPSPAHAGQEFDLQDVIGRIDQKKEVRQIGLGIGPGTEHVKRFYRNNAVVEDVRNLPRAMKDLFQDIIEHPETYS